jgi:hypothetical protein
MAAISIIVSDSREARLLSVLEGITGPVIDYSHGHYVILTHCTTLDSDHIGTYQRDSPAVHLGADHAVDLPLSQVSGNSATWLRPLRDDQPLPNCASTLILVRNLLSDQ